MVVNMAMSWRVSSSRSAIFVAETMPLSTSNSSQYSVSSISLRQSPILEMNSAFERARDASRQFAPTEVPARKTCLPKTCATVSCFGSLEYIRMTRRANCLVRGFKSCGGSFMLSVFSFQPSAFSLSVCWWLFLQFQRLCHHGHIEPVVFHLLDLVPREPGWVFDGVFQMRLGVAVRDDVKPVQVAPVIGDALFVRRQENGARDSADTFDFD